MTDPKRRRARAEEERWWQVPFGRLFSFLSRGIWRVDQSKLNSVQAGLLRVARILIIAVRGFVNDKCLLRSAALTYVTIFSLVPLLAFGFAVAKGLGADERLQNDVIDPFLDQTFGLDEISERELDEIRAPVDAAAEDEPLVDVGSMVAALEVIEGDLPLDEPASEELHDPPTAEAAAEEEEATLTAGAHLRGVSDKIFGFVRDTNFASLGAFSLIFLLYSGIKLLGAVEGALNEVWGVRNTRSFARRVTNYIAIVVLTPLVLISGTTITTFLRSDHLSEYLNLNLSPILGFVSALPVGLGMMYMYIALPNTKVSVLSALLGGLVGGVLWQLAQMLHVEFQVGLAGFNRIYSGFAALPFFLLWIYVNWSILLFGSQLAFAHQNESVFTQIRRTGEVDQAYREALALRLAARITAAFLAGHQAPSSASLAAELGVAPRIVSQVLERLGTGGLTVRTDEESSAGYLPARAPDSITLLDVLVAMRYDEDARRPPTKASIDEQIDRHLRALEAEVEGSLNNKSLSDLAHGVQQDDARTAGKGVVTPAPSV